MLRKVLACDTPLRGGIHKALQKGDRASFPGQSAGREPTHELKYRCRNYGILSVWKATVSGRAHCSICDRSHMDKISLTRQKICSYLS